MKTLKIAALAGVIALAGCSSSDVKNTPASSGGAKQSASETSKSSESSSSSSEGASDSALTKSYGSTFTWDDGVAITISKPQPFTPSDTAATDSKFKKFVVVDITLKNGKKEPLNAFTVTTSATSGSQQSDGVFDSAKGVESPSADILPGKSLQWKQAYGVDESGELVIAVENGFGNAKGYYK